MRLLRPSPSDPPPASYHHRCLPPALRFLTRGLGTDEGGGGELLSLLMFQGEYLSALVDAGKRDAAVRAEQIDAFVAPFA